MKSITSRISFIALGLLMVASPALAQDATAEKGQQVFTASKCSICHSIAGKGNAKGSLDKVGAKLSAAEIREWITDAPAMAAKTKADRKPAMKAYKELAPGDVSALVAYLSTLKK
jgi:mono/diheme cytochrome c family protein